MADNTQKNTQAAEKLKKSQEQMANKIYKEIVKDAKELSMHIRKKDFDGICKVSQRIYKNSDVLK